MSFILSNNNNIDIAVQINISSLNQPINSSVLGPKGLTKCGAAKCLMHLYSLEDSWLSRSIFFTRLGSFSFFNSISNSMGTSFCWDTIHHHKIYIRFAIVIYTDLLQWLFDDATEMEFFILASWSKQWIIIHTSDLMMIIRQSIYSLNHHKGNGNT